ncbi:MAG: chorismate synthase [Verrucomicrobiota bacterium]
MGNVFGNLFRIATWGESHGGGIGVVVDGCPPCLPLSEADLQLELDRRRPGQSDITTPRKETDIATIVSGVYNGKTLGTPIAITVPNSDHRPEAYAEMKDKFRPSHADFTYQTKYGIRNHEGGGRSSARETIGRVAAGAIAKKVLRLGPAEPVEIVSYIERIHNISIPNASDLDGPGIPFPSMEDVEANAVRCPHPETAEKMIARIKEARSEGNSVGGVICCRVRGLPVGLGTPVFDRMEADLAKAMLSLPATKGFEVGSGFAAVGLTGREHNDRFVNREGEIHTETNRSGGVQGGITNGEELYFRVAFKPTATILQSQATVDQSGQETELMGRGRHDPCVVPRAVPIVEAMTALVIVDHWMRQTAQCDTFSFE